MSDYKAKKSISNNNNNNNNNNNDDDDNNNISNNNSKNNGEAAAVPEDQEIARVERNGPANAVCIDACMSESVASHAPPLALLEPPSEPSEDPLLSSLNADEKLHREKTTKNKQQIYILSSSAKESSRDPNI